MSTILVTGASGAIGSWLAKVLIEQKHEVVSILHDNRPFTTSKIIGVHDKISWAHGDLLDESFVKRVVADYAVEAIFHLAALPLVQVGTRTTVPIFQTNILGTVNLLEAVKENHWAGKDIRLLIMASDKVYGNAGERAYVETMPLNGLSVYDVSKACADMISRTYAYCSFAPLVSILRPCNTIVPGDLLNLGRVLPRLIIPAIRGDSPTMYKTEYLREFIWIEDVVNAFLAIDNGLKSQPQRFHGEAFNVGSGQQATLDQVVELVMAHFPGIGVNWTEPPTLSRVEIPFQALDTSKLKEYTTWRPSHTLVDSIRMLIDWTVDHWDSLPEPVKNYRTQGWHA